MQVIDSTCKRDRFIPRKLWKAVLQTETIVDTMTKQVHGKSPATFRTLDYNSFSTSKERSSLMVYNGLFFLATWLFSITFSE